MSDVYVITNLSNNKKYVGITNKTYIERFEKHKENARRNYERFANIALYHAIRKYGENMFRVELLETVNSWDKAKEREKYWINELKSYASGYNNTKGGDGTTGYQFTVEQIKSRKERGLTDKHKRSISEGNARYWLGKTHSEETKAKIRSSRACQTFSEKTRAKMGASKTGVKNHKSKQIQIDGVIYESINLASKILGIHSETVRKRGLNPNFSNYEILTDA